MPPPPCTGWPLVAVVLIICRSPPDEPLDAREHWLPKPPLKMQLFTVAFTVALPEPVRLRLFPPVNGLFVPKVSFVNVMRLSEPLLLAMRKFSTAPPLKEKPLTVAE